MPPPHGRAIGVDRNRRMNSNIVECEQPWGWSPMATLTTIESWRIQ